MQSYDDDDDESMERMENMEVNPSPSLLQPPSGRKGSKKVRSGCITCKIRKVKCDEAKPYCTRCTKTGRKCDGYLDASALAIRRRRRRRSTNPETSLDESSPSISQPYSTSKLQLDADQQYIESLSASAKHRGKQGKEASSPSSTARTPLPQSVDMLSWATSTQEKRAFSFFQTITAPCLAGDLDAVFWRVLVLQVCHTEPAVRHAVLAISSLHEVFLRPKVEASNLKVAKMAKKSSPPDSDTSLVQEFALQQYNKAIAHMLEDMKGDKTSSDDEQEYDESDGDYQNQQNQSHYEEGNRHRNETQNATVLHRPVAPLMTCILFLCIEVMQGKDKEALIHLEQGRHILSQLDGSRKPHGRKGKEARGDKDQKPKRSRRAATGSGGNPAEMAVVRQHLVPLYTRLSMTSFLFGGSPLPIPPSLKSPSPSEAAPATANIPTTFDTIHGLRASVHDFLDTTLRFTRKVRSSKYPKRATSPSTTPSATPASASTSTSASAYHLGSSSSASTFASASLRASVCTLESEKKTLLAQLRRLRIALSLFRINQLPAPAFPIDAKSMPANFNSNAATLALLQIHLSIAEIWLATALTRDEIAFDAHVETFSSVVSLAATVLDTERQQQSLSAQNSLQTSQNPSSCSVFTLETHIIPALYFVATKCRHGPVRHAALAMLSANAGRRENLWRADVLGAIAARIVQIEEGVGSGKKERDKRDKVEQEDNEDGDDTKSKMSHEPSPTPTPTDSLHAISDPWFATSLNINDDLPGLYSPHHVQDWSRTSAQTESAVYPSNATRASSSAGGDSATDTRSGHRRPAWHSSGGSIDGSFLDNDLFYFGDASTRTIPNVPSIPAANHHNEINNEAVAALPALILSPPTPTAYGLSITPAEPTSTKIWPRAASVCSTSDLQSPSSISVSSPAVSSFETESPVSPRGMRGLLDMNMGDSLGRPSTDAPFDVPEHARVHVAVIGADEPKGRWVTLFRKPNGLDGAWDVRSEFVSIASL